MKATLAVLLMASVWLSGCASTKREPVASARINPDIEVPAAARGLVPAARIVPDERPIQLLGQLTAEGRAAFEEERSARIAQRPTAGRDLTGSDIAECLIRGLVILCPVMLVGRGVVLGTVNGIRYIKASAREPSLLIPQQHADSLAVMFKENATGRALGERAARLAMPLQTANGGGDGHVVVRMKTVEASQVRAGMLVIRSIAEAQAFPSSGIAVMPTEHVYEWTYGPLSRWSANSNEVVRQAMDEALDALAESVVSAYARR